MTMAMRAPELRICDDGYFHIGILDYEEFEYEERWNGRDTWTMKVQRSTSLAEYIQKYRIVHYYDPDDGKIRPLVIKEIDVDDTSITVTGNDYLGDLFGVRLALSGTTTDTGYDTQSGNAETVMRHYISANITESVVQQRRDPLLRLEAVDHQKGQNVSIAARFQTLLEVLESCCTQGYVGWESVVVEDDTVDWGWYIEFRVRIGTDRSQVQTNNSPIILSEEFGTALISRFNDPVPETTLVIVGGEGEAAARVQVEIGDTVATGIQRREVFVDARDADTAELLQERGKEALADAEKTNIEVEYLASGSFVYSRDFSIGDIVTVDVGVYGAYDLAIAVVKRSWDTSSYTVSLTLGTELTDVIRLIREQTRKNPDRRK